MEKSLFSDDEQQPQKQQDFNDIVEKQKYRQSSQTSASYEEQFETLRFNMEENTNLMDLEIVDSNQEQIIKYNAFLNDRIILIEPPLLINDGYIKSYKLYKIKSKKIGAKMYDTIVERRYSDFQYLNEQLIQSYGGLVIPKLPQKNFWVSFNMQGKQYQDHRTKSLTKYLNRLLKHKQLRSSKQLNYFLFKNDDTFSAKKGQHTDKQNNIQKVVKQIGFGAFDLGKQLYSKLTSKQNKEIFFQLSASKLTKQDHILGEYQIVINQLIKVSKQLKAIVQITSNQINQIEQFKSLFSIIDKPSKLGSGSKINKISESAIKLQNDQLCNQYEDLCQFIDSCSQALTRRKKLRIEIEQLKKQEIQAKEKLKTSPRNNQLDIIRSKLNNWQTKCDKWTQQLIKQLQFYSEQGKGMLRKFVSNFQKVKKQFYCTSFSSL